jgi:hypothetical protein
MKPRSFLLTSLVAGAACLTQPAAAQSIARSSPVVTVDDDRGGFNAYVGDTFGAATVDNAFSDIFTFSLGTPFDAAAAVTSSYLNTPFTKDLLITGLSLYRYDPASKVILGTAIAGIDETGIEAHPTDSWSLSGFGLASGDYALKVDGRVLGAGGGAFGGDLTISPVPEAQRWGMLLGGLGILGALAWRRKPGT